MKNKFVFVLSTLIAVLLLSLPAIAATSNLVNTQNETVQRNTVDTNANLFPEKNFTAQGVQHFNTFVSNVSINGLNLTTALEVQSPIEIVLNSSDSRGTGIGVHCHAYA